MLSNLLHVGLQLLCSQLCTIGPPLESRRPRLLKVPSCTRQLQSNPKLPNTQTLHSLCQLHSLIGTKRPAIRSDTQHAAALPWRCSAPRL